jgi:hypothetical protein
MLRNTAATEKLGRYVAKKIEKAFGVASQKDEPQVRAQLGNDKQS